MKLKFSVFTNSCIFVQWILNSFIPNYPDYKERHVPCIKLVRSNNINITNLPIFRQSTPPQSTVSLTLRTVQAIDPGSRSDYLSRSPIVTNFLTKLGFATTPEHAMAWLSCTGLKTGCHAELMKIWRILLTIWNMKILKYVDVMWWGQHFYKCSDSQCKRCRQRTKTQTLTLKSHDDWYKSLKSRKSNSNTFSSSVGNDFLQSFLISLWIFCLTVCRVRHAMNRRVKSAQTAAARPQPHPAGRECWLWTTLGHHFQVTN